jgi:hypothetical protein
MLRPSTGKEERRQKDNAEPFDPRDLLAEPTARISRFWRCRLHGAPRNRVYLD